MNPRKIFTIFFITVLFFLLSCSKDDNPTSPEDSIVGTWVLTKIIIPNFGNMELTPQEAGLSITFKMKSDKTFETIYTESGNTETETGTWSISDGKITLTSSTGETQTLDYTIEGNKLRVPTQIQIENMGELSVIMEFTKQ